MRAISCGSMILPKQNVLMYNAWIVASVSLLLLAPLFRQLDRQVACKCATTDVKSVLAMSALKEALKEPIKEPADLDYNINRFYSVVLASSAKFVAQLENLKSYSHIAKKMHNANLSQAIDNYVANEWFVINIARRLEKPHGKTCPAESPLHFRARTVYALASDIRGTIVLKPDYDLRLSELGALGQLIIKCDYWFQKMLSAGNDDTKVGFIDSAIETALFLKAYSKVAVSAKPTDASKVAGEVGSTMATLLADALKPSVPSAQQQSGAATAVTTELAAQREADEAKKTGSV